LPSKSTGGGPSSSTNSDHPVPRFNFLYGEQGEKDPWLARRGMVGRIGSCSLCRIVKPTGCGLSRLSRVAVEPIVALLEFLFRSSDLIQGLVFHHEA
jgi:hypothetical protein